MISTICKPDASLPTSGGPLFRYEFAGLSTDTKPNDSAIANGSVFVEMDTGHVFMFDADSTTWRAI